MREFSASFVDRQVLSFKFWFDKSERAGYDRLEVWRSTSGDGGPYVELTGETWGPARLTGRRIPGSLVDKALILLLGEKEVTITFTGSDPLTQGDVSAQIEYQGAGLLAALLSDSSPFLLTLESTDVGCKARLEVIGGSAAPILGFSTASPTNRAYGTDARLVLGSTSAYSFEDPWTKEGCSYKTRLRRDFTGVVSEFSNPVSSNVVHVVTPDKLIRAWLRLVDFQGRPVANRSVMISTKGTVHVLAIDNNLVDFSDQVLYTDVNGYCSLLIMRGVEVTVGIGGTGLVRDVTPPTDPTLEDFNMFDPVYGSDDAFSVQVPDINLATKRECP